MIQGIIATSLGWVCAVKPQPRVGEMSTTSWETGHVSRRLTSDGVAHLRASPVRSAEEERVLSRVHSIWVIKLCIGLRVWKTYWFARLNWSFLTCCFALHLIMWILIYIYICACDFMQASGIIATVVSIYFLCFVTSIAQHFVFCIKPIIYVGFRPFPAAAWHWCLSWSSWLS